MAAQGRGSAAAGNVAVVIGLLLVCVLLNAHVASATVFNVGDRGGWSFNTNSLPTGKRFKAGDVLGTLTASAVLCMHATKCSFSCSGVMRRSTNI